MCSHIYGNEENAQQKEMFIGVWIKVEYCVFPALVDPWQNIENIEQQHTRKLGENI